MKDDKQKLGRGLSVFFENNDLLEDEDSNLKQVKNIEISKIGCNPYQPRRVFDNEQLESLAQSIRENGIIQPIIVYKNNNMYIIIAGERRFRAAKIAGLTEIPCIISEQKSDEKLLEIAILENIQREDLDSIEEAEAYQKLIENFGYTQDQLGEKLGKSRSHITNILRLNSLPEVVKALIHEKKLSFGHARSLVGVQNAVDIANRIITEGLSVRQVEKIIQDQKIKLKSDDDMFFGLDSSEEANISEQLSNILGLKVNLKMKNRGGGVIEIKFRNVDELDSLMSKLN